MVALFTGKARQILAPAGTGIALGAESPLVVALVGKLKRNDIQRFMNMSSKIYLSRKPEEAEEKDRSK